MRSHPSTRQIIFGLALAAVVSACSSGASSASSSSSFTHAQSSPPPLVLAPVTIRTNWEAFFSGKTSTAEKISLLENGQVFASIIEAQTGSSLANSAAAKVVALNVTSSTRATVIYNVLLKGATVLRAQTGQAVYKEGTWKVGDASFCRLLALENRGKTPSVCRSAAK